MKTPLALSLCAALVLASGSAAATGRTTCNAGPKDAWKPRAELEKTLAAKKWKVQTVKVDGGCYEVYGVNEKGEKVEAYFHPVTLELVTQKSR